ncbi:hypothetical protein EMIHUDRAFT_438648 [Emiliania huxleyi CCMP1516]|uniref:Uncharacterized protein n=2 Tax=Emiliania huxleyi TaxID=2903 RepID=A0A0D3I678_EMIH1|nr:hypothetical protein EMIHUDRAFT_438648 [Emiliania huxleyi CCMP1516]EOD06763.1 hypothetical protein EMIHUDRAFT_438648 [Emiliania huxleyi CCMP1516]|eukprot:XP_005759192.1 hypothetical protein EMIHUDRAFT_438648 [Emiliania huxleyi CCMP1516]
MISRISGRWRSTSRARRSSSSSSRRATSAPRTASERSARRSRRTSRSSSSKKRTLKRAAGRSRRCAASAPRTCSRPSLTTTGRSRFGIASMSFSSSRSRSSPRRCSSARPTFWTGPPFRSACRVSSRASRSPFPNRARSGPRQPTRGRWRWPMRSPPLLPQIVRPPVSRSAPPMIGRPARRTCCSTSTRTASSATSGWPSRSSRRGRTG